MENRHGSSRGSKKPSKDLWAETGSIVVAALCVFTLCALLTYFPGDPSFFSNSRAVPHNACGRLGALLSSLVLQWFGLGAYLLPAALFFIATAIHKREGWLRVAGTLGGMALSVGSLAVFLTLQWKYWPISGTLMLTGGVLGAWASGALVQQLNPLGASMASLLVFCLALVLSTPVSVARVGAFVLRNLGRIAWKFGKLISAYILYFVGLALVRLARGSGDLLQKAIESARARARERATAIQSQFAEGEGDPIEPSLALMPAEVQSVLPAENHPPNPERENIGEITLTPVFSTSAPEPKSGCEPAIVPYEKETPVEIKLETVVNKVADKLAKAAARVRRGQWKLPTIEFLKKPPKIESLIDREKLIANSQILRQKFADFGIDGDVTAVRPGPVITLYEFKPGPGVKVSRIAALADDLSMALSAQSVRILAPLPGKAVVGIEIPSETRETVYLREFLQHPDFYGPKHSIPVVMGKDIGGQTYLSDLARMPHLLCAGQTGAGKSVFMNGLICSLFYRFTPDELRMILVDPKFIEFRSYQDIPHLLLPVVDDPKHASTALKWAVREMDRRYRILAKVGSRNLGGFNQKVEEMGADVVRDLLLSEENQSETPQFSGSDWIEAFEPDETGAPRVGKLPYIVVIIDELADLMMIARKEVEISIARIAQKARAAGIHLVIATQRPSTDVITGLIKANLPSRVSFQLASYIDSKTILDRAGAERLLGQGDMLFIPPGISQTLRLHGAWVDDEEINKITIFLKSQGKPAYRDEILLSEEEDEDEDLEMSASDDKFDEAVELVKRSGHASASFLQRHLKVGYNRAARMIETMEARGIVGPADGARPREVLMR